MTLQDGSRNCLGIPRDTQRKKRNRAKYFAESHLGDARFVGGVVLCLHEGNNEGVAGYWHRVMAWIEAIAQSFGR